MDRIPLTAQVNAEGRSTTLYVRDVHNQFSEQNLWWNNPAGPELLEVADERLLSRRMHRTSDWVPAPSGLVWDAAIEPMQSGTVAIRIGGTVRVLYALGLPGMPASTRLVEADPRREAVELLAGYGYKVPGIWRKCCVGWRAVAVHVEAPVLAHA